MVIVNISGQSVEKGSQYGDSKYKWSVSGISILYETLYIRYGSFKAMIRKGKKKTICIILILNIIIYGGVLICCT
jgi:uncharacterized membrane protein